MANAADDGYRRGDDRARQRLIVEGPQILERAAAARQNEHIALGAPAGCANGRGDFRGRRRALHGHRIDQHRNRGKSPRQHMQDVANRGAGGGGDHADSLRDHGQRALALRRKQSFRREFCRQFLELTLKSAEPGIFHVIDDQLIFAARLIEPDARAHQHLLAIPRREGTQHISLPEHAAAYLRGRVFQREIPMPGAGLGKVGDLRLEPKAAETALQQHSHLAIEARNAINVAICGGFHGAMILRFTAPHLQGTMRRLLDEPGTRTRMRILEEALTFDDVLLVPAYSEVLPRDVSLASKLTREIQVNLPVVSAAMDTVTEARLAITIAQEGGIGIIHKNMSIDAQARQVDRVKKFESGVISDPITVNPDMTIRQVLELTRAKNISGVPVVLGTKVVGIVTHRDLRFETKLDAPVSSVMTPKDRLITVRENAPKDQVLALLHKHRIEKVLVVAGDHELKGMITVKDFQKATEFPNACKDSVGSLRVGAAVGTSPDTLDRVGALREAGVDVVVVDTSHGHSRGVLETVSRIKAKYPDIQVIGGNIVTAEAALDLVKHGVDAVKVGIGPGSICTTRVIAGVGVPQISAIARVAKALEGTGVPVIGDGGIRYSGDIAKALAAGAHCVMIGGMFAGTEESPGEVELYQGGSYKAYRGMGSLGAMAQTHGSSDRYFQDTTSELEKLVPEGIEGRVPYKGSLVAILHQLSGGLRAAMGYTGSGSIEEMRTRPQFVRITSAGVRESHVHDVTITKEAPNYRIG